MVPEPVIFNLPDAEATRSLGVRLGKTLEAGNVILLQGDLGSGKTTLVQGIGAGLGIPEAIDSPTFTLINEYLGGRLPLYHLDLYRLDGPEIADLHLENYWDAREVEPGIVAIEWSDRLSNLPDSYLQVCLTDDPYTQARKAMVSAYAFHSAPLSLLLSSL